MVEQEQFNENVSEWIRITNARLSNIMENVDDLTLAVEEDLQTLSYQYQIIKDLRKRVMTLERKLVSKEKCI